MAPSVLLLITWLLAISLAWLEPLGGLVTGAFGYWLCMGEVQQQPWGHFPLNILSKC